MLHRWPERLWIVRHGESAGNVARDLAHSAGAARLDLDWRDVDVPLSELGNRQSEALGRWFGRLAEENRPQVVLASPYLRARKTAELLYRAGGLGDSASHFIIDERLREKELGLLDRLTRVGIEKFYPEQAELRRVLGKFYYRPPSGESWCDVILRLRSAMDTIGLHHGGKRVLIVSHQVVVLCLRYLIENLTESEILSIDAQGDVANCAVTEYRSDQTDNQAGTLTLERYNFVAPLQQEGAAVTAEPATEAAEP
jgi:broad specificity phosphatase PhoE